MRHLLYLNAFIIALISVPATLANAGEQYLTDYNKLLTNHVIEGEQQGISATLIDYSSWSKDPLHQTVLNSFQAINPSLLAGNEIMAFWINAYNLLTIDLIINTGETESIRNQGSLFQNVWESHEWEINGAPYTLDQIEHEILRPMGDPRIHMAINCASLSCPDLLTEAYLATKLDSQLEQQTKRFITNQTKGVLVTDAGLTISEIFDWFDEDFGDTAGVLKFVQSYLPNTKNLEIADYFDYNWKLNKL